MRPVSQMPPYGRQNDCPEWWLDFLNANVFFLNVLFILFLAVCCVFLKPTEGLASQLRGVQASRQVCLLLWSGPRTTVLQWQGLLGSRAQAAEVVAARSFLASSHSR